LAAKGGHFRNVDWARKAKLDMADGSGRWRGRKHA